mgnify:CR=1 FL=1
MNNDIKKIQEILDTVVKMLKENKSCDEIYEYISKPSESNGDVVDKDKNGFNGNELVLTFVNLDGKTENTCDFIGKESSDIPFPVSDPSIENSYFFVLKGGRLVGIDRDTGDYREIKLDDVK